MHDLTLLLCRFVKLGCFVIVQPAPQNFQNFRPRFPRGTHDKDMAEPSLVFPIGLRQRDLNRFGKLPRSVAPVPTRPQTEPIEVATPGTRRSAGGCEMPPSNPPQADYARFRQTPPAESPDPLSGLRAAISSAHAVEPQHGRTSFAASSAGRPFHRASASLMSSARPQPTFQGTPRPDCVPPLSDILP